jgi:hypothetical protein
VNAINNGDGKKFITEFQYTKIVHKKTDFTCGRFGSAGSKYDSVRKFDLFLTEKYVIKRVGITFPHVFNDIIICCGKLNAPLLV